MPVPGYDVQILAEDGTRLPPGEEGAIAIQLPLPPGTLLTVWRDQERYRTSYLTAYEGYYLSGDSGYLDQDGYLFVMGRSDDVMNVAGHRLSSGAIEAVIAQHPAVAEGAVISLPDPVKGERPCGLVVLKSGAQIDRGQLASELIAAVRAQIGPVADLKQIQIVEALPKTRSGKILRKTMRDLARGLDPGTPSTIENPEVLTAIAPVLCSLTVEGGPAPRAPEQSGGSVTSSQWHSVTDPQGR
jgi:propionyl-CoA synthetase